MSQKCTLCQRDFFRRTMKRMLVLTNYAKNWANTIYLRLKVPPSNWFLHVSFSHFALNLSLKTQLQCFLPFLPQVNALTFACRTLSYAQKGCSPYRANFSANPESNLNPGFFFFCSKAFPRIIFVIPSSISNHQIVHEKNKTEFVLFKLLYLSSILHKPWVILTQLWITQPRILKKIEHK